MSAIFSAKNFGFFEIMVGPHRQRVRGSSQCGQGGGGQILCRRPLWTALNISQNRQNTHIFKH